MTCIAPGQVESEQLVAYATGEGDARTARHIEVCPACAAEVRDYAHLDRLLHLRLFRHTCPDAHTLGELAMEILPPQDALLIRQHVAGCPHCAAELEVLRAELAGDPLEELRPRPGLLKRLVATLMPAPAPGLAPAGVRGVGNGTTRTYQAETVTISLTVEPEASCGGRYWMLLVLAFDEETGESLSGAMLRLLDRTAAPVETPLDEWGNATLPGLRAGTYTLELMLPDRVIVIDDIEIGVARE